MKSLSIVHQRLVGILSGIAGAMIGAMGGAGLGLVYVRTFMPHAELEGVILLLLSSLIGVLAGSILGPTYPHSLTRRWVGFWIVPLLLVIVLSGSALILQHMTGFVCLVVLVTGTISGFVSDLGRGS